MQFSVVFLAVLALAAAIPQTPKQQAADQVLLKKQQDVLVLLENINGPIPDEQLHAIGMSYDIENNLHNYVDPNVVKYVVGSVVTNNVQPFHTPFASSVSRLRREIAVLHRILLGAKDYDTFLKTAAWIRVNFNEYQFMKAFVTAVLIRQDTQGVILPPPYEVFPHYFFDSRIIQQVQDIKTHGVKNLVSGSVAYIPVNYTVQVEEGENKLNYFTQDIGLAAYYTYVSYAGYMQPESFGVPSGQPIDVNNFEKIGRGARYYYLHQQLLARYNLERLSNGLGPIEYLDLDDEITVPFKPNQRYTNGLEFPGRPEYVKLIQRNPELLQAIHKFEKRILDAIDSGNVLTPQGVLVSILNPQGLNILGNLIEATGKSINPRYYGNLVAATKQLLGVTPEFADIWDYTPSALEIHETAVKDPAFYQLYKKILKLFEKYQEGLPHHVYNDVVLPGVTIEQVVVSPLVTYFGDFIASLDNAVVEPVGGADNVNVKAQLKRLDHHPYELQIIVKSDKSITNAVVRVYVGPKYNHKGQHIDINKDRLAFVELDQFLFNLVEGQNIIVRHSHQASSQSYDWPSFNAIKDAVDAAVRSQNPFYITEPQQIFGFPARLSLPKGTQNGFPLQLIVAISAQEQVVPESYVGIVPENLQNYNEHTFHIVNEEEYNQHVSVQVSNVTPVNTCAASIAVIPDIEKINVPSAKRHYGYLYKHYPGHQSFPRWQQHHYYPGEGEGQHNLGLLNSGLPLGHQGGIPYLQHAAGIGQPLPGQQVVGQVNAEGQIGIVQGSPMVHGGLNGYVKIPQVGQIPVGQQGQNVKGVHGLKHGMKGHRVNVAGSGPLLGAANVDSYGHHVGSLMGSGVYGGINGIHGGPHNHGYAQAIPEGVKANAYGGVNANAYGGVNYGAHVNKGILGAYGVHGSHHGSGHYPVQFESVQGYNVHDEQLYNYYESQPISQVIGGAISLDGKPLGWPLDRPLDISALYAPNIHVTDVVVHHVDYPVNPVTGQEIYAN